LALQVHVGICCVGFTAKAIEDEEGAVLAPSCDRKIAMLAAEDGPVSQYNSARYRAHQIECVGCGTVDIPKDGWDLRFLIHNSAFTRIEADKMFCHF